MKISVLDNYKLYGKCLHMTNDIIEVVATIDVGPRIVHFSFVDGTNVLHSDRDSFNPLTGKKFDEHYYKGAAWENLGGHRLWISPESLPETYYPDTDPIEYEIENNTIRLIQAPQEVNGVAISLEITMEDNSNEIEVVNKCKNISGDIKEFAPWAITVLAKGGVEIIPLNTNNTGLLPNRILSLWPYTNLQDERLFIGNKYITVKQDESKPEALKIGTDNNAGIAFYVLNDVVFCKKYNHILGGSYADGGVSFETYTNSNIIECETLGELKSVKAEETVIHKEYFSLYKNKSQFDYKNDNSISEFLKIIK